MTAEYSKTLEEIAKPFIESGIYDSTDSFVSNLVKDFATRKIKQYERKIKALETKYGSFEKFTRKLSVKAFPKQEDQWMEWEAARNILNAWKHVACELGSGAA
jgi:hypothetical protein